MNNLLSVKFWLNLRPGSLLPIYQKIFIVFVVILVILTFAFNFLEKRNKKNLYSRFWRAFYYFSLTNVIVGLILLFFTYELVPFLSARFWFLFWGIEMIAWRFFIIRILREIPKKREQFEKEKELKKYIP